MNDAGSLPTPPAAALHHTRRRIRALRVLLLVVLLPLALLLAAGAAATALITRLPAYDGVPRETLSLALGNVALDLAGEQPRFAAEPPTGAVPICRDTPAAAIKPLRQAFALMRGTEQGRELYDLLLSQGVCVRVADLPYNAAYASVESANGREWSASQIVVDRRLLRSSRGDVLAAVLVHEATHIRRAVDGEACYIGRDTCTMLPNGVPLEEEVAAHSAEAEWWIAAFGRNGKRFAVRTDSGLNALVRAYLRGPSAFDAYVRSIRSDPREGDGF